MKPPLPRILSDVPRTLHAQLEIAKAIRTLMGSDEHELARQRRDEIAAIRSDLEALTRDIPKVFAEAAALAKAEFSATLRKYSPNQPRVPTGNRDDGQWTSGSKAGGDAPSASSGFGVAKPGETSRSRLQYAALEDGTLSDVTESGQSAHDAGGRVGTRPAPDLQYAANGTFPPPPPGYDPNTWKQGGWRPGKYWLEDLSGRKYTIHPEDDFHWRHWDKDDGSRWPSNSKKPWTTQKRPLDPDQSLSDPNGDEPPWTPSPLVPTVPEPVLPIPGYPAEPFIPRVLIPE